MNTQQFLISGWTWNPVVILCCVAALAAYLAAFRAQMRFWYFAAAIGAVFLALISPVNALADGYLFSAHMFQHMLLLLIAPALIILSLPPNFLNLALALNPWSKSKIKSKNTMAALLRPLTHPILGWLAGVGSMWIWHAPALCNAATTSRPVFAFQTISLLALGGAFWWQVIAPRDRDRLSAPAAIIYLFTACLACSAIGIILTFSPVTVCSVYMHPVDRLGMLNTIRSSWGMTPEKDQQIGGLLMWVPMCMIYLAAIFAQLARWFHQPAPGPGVTIQ